MYLYLSNKPATLPLKIANMMVINTQLSPGAWGQEVKSYTKKEKSSCFRALKHLYICLSAEINANKHSTRAKVQPSQCMDLPLKWFLWRQNNSLRLQFNRALTHWPTSADWWTVWSQPSTMLELKPSKCSWTQKWTNSDGRNFCVILYIVEIHTHLVQKNLQLQPW